MSRRKYIRSVGLGCLLILVAAFGQIGGLYSQQSLTEVKRLAYGDPFNTTNENFINMTNALENNKDVSLLLFKEWQSLEIRGNDEELVLIDSANYHIQADKILFVYGGEMFELFPEKIEQAKLGSSNFVSLIFDTGKKELVRGYFEVLEEGDFILLRRWEMDKQVSNSSPLGLPATKEEKLVQASDLYYLYGSRGRPLEVPHKKSELIEIFRRDRMDMVDYAKKYKLSPKEEEDVIQLFKYYNSLAD